METIRANSGIINRQFFQSRFRVVRTESRALQATPRNPISELYRLLAPAEQETRTRAARHADPADQAAAEYERQSIVHRSNTARQMLRTLTQALERIRQGSFGECLRAAVGIEPKAAGSDSVGTVLRQMSGSQGSRPDIWRFHQPPALFKAW